MDVAGEKRLRKKHISNRSTRRNLSNGVSLENSHPPLEQRASQTEALWVALQQCNDLIVLQHTLLTVSLREQKELKEKVQSERKECKDIWKKFDSERVEHTKTKCFLSAEEEKAQLALTEVQVLTKQLHRETATFEKAFGLLNSQALSDSTKSESILAKSSALETLNRSKDESIARLEVQVQELTQRMKDMKRAHKMELQELNVRMQQEIYLARQYREMDSTTSRKETVGGITRNTGGSSRGKKQLKLRETSTHHQSS